MYQAAPLWGLLATQLHGPQSRQVNKPVHFCLQELRGKILVKGKKLRTLEEDLEEEEEEEELESELEREQEADPELEAQLESEPQALSPRSKDKKKEKVGQQSGLSALAFGQSVP